MAIPVAEPIINRPRDLVSPTGRRVAAALEPRAAELSPTGDELPIRKLIEIQDVENWPTPSNASTAIMAIDLRAVTITDPHSVFPETDIEDGFGI